PTRHRVLSQDQMPRLVFRKGIFILARNKRGRGVAGRGGDGPRVQEERPGGAGAAAGKGEKRFFQTSFLRFALEKKDSSQGSRIPPQGPIFLGFDFLKTRRHVFSRQK